MSDNADTPEVAHDPLGPSHRVLAWLDPHSDRIGAQVFPRNTAEGLSAHLSDDPNTPGGFDAADITALLKELEEKGMVHDAGDGTWQRTPLGDETLGGVVYAAQKNTRASKE
jgi:hypothetical protein